MAGGAGGEPVEQLRDGGDIGGQGDILRAEADLFPDPREVEQLHQLSICFRPTRR